MGPLMDKNEGSSGGSLSEEALAQIGTLITTAVSTQFSDLTNKYDKKLKGHAKDIVAPMLEDLKKSSKAGKDGDGGKAKLKKVVSRLLESGKTQEEIKAMGLKIPKSLRDVEPPADKNKDDKSGDRKEFKDVVGKKKLKRLEAEIEQIKAEREKAVKEAQEATLNGEIREMLGEFTWTNPKAQKAVFNEIKEQVSRDADTGTLVIDDTKLDDWIKVKVPEEYEWALKPENKSGAGPTKGSGKAKGLDMDSFNGMKSDELAGVGAKLAEMVGAGVKV